MKKSLNIAGTINLIFAFIAYTTSVGILYPLILAVLSIICFSYSSKTIPYLYDKKSSITLISIINFFVNPISGIIMLIGRDKLSKEYEKSDKKLETIELSKEDRKISTLLNLGITLVSISGIILTTTNWNIISNTLKISILIVIALLFLCLSILSEKKLKIEILSKNYWLISMLFIILTVIANGYLEVTSNWFSFYGTGKYLYIAFTSIVISLISLITNNKFEQNTYKNICYIGIIISISSILLHFNIEVEIILILLTTGLIVLNVIKNEKLSDIKELSKYLTIGLSILSIIVLLDTENVIYQVILSILSIINIISITKTTLEGVVAPFIINTTIFITLIKLPEISNLTDESTSIIAIIIYSSIYLLNIVKNENINKVFKTIMNVICNIAMAVLLITSIDDKILLTIISAFIALTGLINYHENTIKAEKVLTPIKIIIFIMSLIALIQEIIKVDPAYILIILYVITFLIYKLINKEKIKTITLIMYYILFGLSLLINEYHELIPSIINLVSASSVFLLISEEQNNKKTKFAYITLIITIASILAYTNILNTNPINNGIIILLIYAMLTILTRENKNINKINYLSIIIPLYVMTTDENCINEIALIIENIIGLYLITLINIFLIKNEKDRNTLSTILSTIIILGIMFTESWMIGLYIGIISLILIIIGFIKKEYKGLFVEGIVITIINIIYQFNYFFQDLPLWLYTLLAGLLIIGIVTYKVANDRDNK